MQGQSLKTKQNKTRNSVSLIREWWREREDPSPQFIQRKTEYKE